MQDLTKIEKPFGLLDKETQERLRAHGGPYQLLFPISGWNDWKHPDWKSSSTFRVKPQPEPKAPEKPEVKVGSWWKDVDGDLFEVLCICDKNAFIHYVGLNRGHVRYLDAFRDFTPQHAPDPLN